MKDPRIEDPKAHPMQFDGMRIIYGTFLPALDLR